MVNLDTPVTLNKTSSPRNKFEKKAPVADDIKMGIKIVVEKCGNITSVANITPAIGALKIAAMVAAVPQPINRVRYL